MKKTQIVVVAGPTAVGKTKYAIEIAKKFNGEVISCDSMQLYKYMDIGSAKPDKEEQSQAVHHLIDFVDPREDFSVYKYQKLAKATISEVASRGKLPVISGGTGLYLNSILYDMDFSEAEVDLSYRQELEAFADENGNEALHKLLEERDLEAASKIHLNNRKKIIRALERIRGGEGHLRGFHEPRESEDIDPLLVGLTRDRQELYNRINLRVDMLMDMGLVEEVKSLSKLGLNSQDISMKGIGYKEIFDYLDGLCTREEAVETIKKNTRHYAKRQLTWFRRYDRMNWYNLSEYLNDEEAIEDISKWLKANL